MPAQVLATVRQRLERRHGCTLAQAAEQLSVARSWIDQRRLDGTVQVIEDPRDPRRYLLSEAMLRRLEQAKYLVQEEAPLDAQWLRLSQAALEAGVSGTTLNKWANKGEVQRVDRPGGWRYLRADVRARARIFWRNSRI